jgi:hypothetical protein
MADVLKYGWAYGGKQGQEMAVGNAQSFYRTGGAFVTASNISQAVTVMNLCTASTDGVVGWAEVPRAAVPGIVDWWTSPADSNADDKIHVITDPTAVYALPVDESAASLGLGNIGMYAGLVVSASIQYAYAQVVVATTNKQLFVVDVDVAEKIMYVRINPGHDLV